MLVRGFGPFKPGRSVGMPTASTAQTRTPVGGTERAFFFGPDGALFGYTHAPAVEPAWGLLICSPLHAELGKNYRREVLIARSLAAHGVLVQRFHYRGAGHSAGDPTRLTLDSMVDDAVTALEQTEALAPDRPVAVLGTRLGALVACAAAAHRADIPVVVWEPTVSAQKHFRDVLRAGIVRGLKSGEAADAPEQFSLSRLELDGVVDVLGYPITWRLYESLADSSISSALGDGPRPVQVVQFGGRAPTRPDLLAEVDQLGRQGAKASLDRVETEETWWFGGTGGVGWSREAVMALADLSSGWLQGHIGDARSEMP